MFVTNVIPIHFVFCEGQKIIVLEQLFRFNGPAKIAENPYEEAFIHYTEKERFFFN
jgi:hypothetical protein